MQETKLKFIPWSDLSTSKELARGTFGCVYKGTWGWWNKVDVAIKQPRETLPAYLKEEFINEAKIMAECKSPYIVTLYGVCTEGDHNDLVMEYVPNGSLHSLLQNKSKEISWNLRCEIALDIGKGLSYLHDEKNILHRDLKSLNILLGVDYHAKICDFGLSKVKLESSTFEPLGKNYPKGTICWAAPEVLKDAAAPSKASDIYSYGMILWEIASREKPYKNAMDGLIVIDWIKSGKKEEIPKDCPADYGNIVKECWIDEPKSRPSAKEVVTKLLKTKTNFQPVKPCNHEAEILNLKQMLAQQELQLKQLEQLKQQKMLAEQENNKLKQEAQNKDKIIAQQSKELEMKDSEIKTNRLDIDGLKSKLNQTEKALQASKEEALNLKKASNPDLSISIKKLPPHTVLYPPANPQDEATKKDLDLLLKWVTEGHLVEVENLLKKNPNLALMKGSVTDLSGRTFKDISAFQYAAWALDTEMCELMLHKAGNAGAAVADTQLNELEKNPWGHGSHYDPSPLVKKAQKYIKNCDEWSVDKCKEYWQKEVGGEQRKCPAWLIYAWCEEGKEVAWVKKDLKNIKVMRQYDKGHVKWWFEKEYNGGKGVGSTWSCVRGDWETILDIYATVFKSKSIIYICIIVLSYTR